jgi:hypothetical protein
VTSVPLGKGAYERLYAGAPLIELLNRWLEANPANLREGTSVLARPGTNQIVNPLSQGSFVGFGSMRGNYSLSGLFGGDLFVVCGSNLYRFTDNGNGTITTTAITGTINGSGYPEVAWQAGIGYQRLWISDGTLLQYYQGLSSASGTLTLVNPVVPGTDVFEVGGVYYGFGTTFSGTDAGTSGHPFIINPTSISSGLDPIDQIVLAITGTGIAGTDYSTTLTGPNTLVTAANNSGVIPGTSAKISALVAGSSGNSITFTVTGGTALTASGSGTLVSGGLNALQGCTMPGGVTPGSITQVSSYVLVAQSNSQEFFWVDPGEVTIDPLNFASKESSPDPIQCMRAVGDQVMIMGSKSTENWYATGNLAAPFAPIEGRVYARGVMAGTPVVIDDGVVLVGDDGRVYSIGYQPGDSTDTSWGVNRISNNGIEERIRYQNRRQDGLTP